MFCSFFCLLVRELQDLLKIPRWRRKEKDYWKGNTTCEWDDGGTIGKIILTEIFPWGHETWYLKSRSLAWRSTNLAILVQLPFETHKCHLQSIVICDTIQKADIISLFSVNNDFENSTCKWDDGGTIDNIILTEIFPPVHVTCYLKLLAF